mmetsp:Transcript_10172/g.16448  ORF Transcript_10172/g.16448 Transcript_10172/m.16448 type:complete len:386 (-) Transcript_10172:29-1186(-)
MDFKLISGEKGSGFFGKIVVAERKATGNMVAIKEQKKNECMSNEELDEVQILSLLGKHRNVVEFLGTVTFEGKVGLVTRFYPRFSLDRMHQKMNLCANDAVRRIAGDILRGLAFIHDRNIVHRDLACRNFFMDNDGTVVIGDFGLACSLDRKRPFDLLAKPVPKYSRAPESIRSCNMSLKSDIWMLGVAFCVLLQKGDKGVEASIFHIASRFLKENKNAIKKGGRTNTTDDGEEDDDVAAELLRKIIPRASSETTPNNLSHSSTILLQNLIRKCLRFDPKDRPCASLLAEYVLRIENQGAGELHQGPSSPSPSRSKYGVAAKPSAAAMVEAAMAATRAASMSGANEGNATKDGVDDGGASQQSSTESKTREYDLYRLLGQDDFHK